MGANANASVTTRECFSFPRVAVSSKRLSVSTRHLLGKVTEPFVYTGDVYDARLVRVFVACGLISERTA